ncbi:MAG: hypothetical protein IKH86_10985 [Prevotella sp.]|jgi:hypothetical protein|nr:hypothetical protein [Prevotella sp.]
MTVLTGLLAFVALALLGWAIAEGKDKVFSYHNNDEEQESLNRTHEMQKQNDYAELDINDVIRTISTKGFSA